MLPAANAVGASGAVLGVDLTQQMLDIARTRVDAAGFTNVELVCADMRDVAHVEIDMDANPAAARRLSVLSLPTTFIFDADGRQRYRTSGVPKATDLRSALEPLLA